MNEIDTVAESLFEKIRGAFSNIVLGDEEAAPVTDPKMARYFDFEYTDKENDLGNVSINIADPGKLKIYYSNNITSGLEGESKKKWYNFLRDMRQFARRNVMGFDIYDISKSRLDKKDYDYLQTQMTTESKMYGTRRSSYERVGECKIIIRHNVAIDEEIRGSRSRNIASIYIENADKERFKFPVNYLSGARAMARHVNEGGSVHDDIGSHLVHMVEDMKTLQTFYLNNKNLMFDDIESTTIVEATKEQYHSLRESLKKITSASGYTSFAESFELTEREAIDEEKLSEIKDKLTRRVFDAQFEDMLPLVYNAYQKKLAEADTAYADDYDDADAYDGSDARDFLSVVEKIRHPEFRLVLKRDDSADDLIRNTKHTDNKVLLSNILGDIAQRAIGADADEIANFAGEASDAMDSSDQSFGQAVDKDNKRAAIDLAKKYIQDLNKMRKDPEYKSEVRKDPSDVYSRKTFKRKSASESYADWADQLVEGTWALPDTDEDVEQLVELLSEPLPVRNYMVLYDLIGDDELFDSIGELEADGDPEADIRPIVISKIKEFIFNAGHGDEPGSNAAPAYQEKLEQVLNRIDYQGESQLNDDETHAQRMSHAVDSILSNFKKKLLPKHTAMRQLKDKGIDDNDIDHMLNRSFDDESNESIEDSKPKRKSKRKPYDLTAAFNMWQIPGADDTTDDDEEEAVEEETYGRDHPDNDPDYCETCDETGRAPDGSDCPACGGAGYHKEKSNVKYSRGRMEEDSSSGLVNLSPMSGDDRMDIIDAAEKAGLEHYRDPDGGYNQIIKVERDSSTASFLLARLHSLGVQFDDESDMDASSKGHIMGGPDDYDDEEDYEDYENTTGDDRRNNGFVEAEMADGDDYEDPYLSGELQKYDPKDLADMMEARLGTAIADQFRGLYGIESSFNQNLHGNPQTMDDQNPHALSKIAEFLMAKGEEDVAMEIKEYLMMAHGMNEAGSFTKKDKPYLDPKLDPKRAEKDDKNAMASLVKGKYQKESEEVDESLEWLQRAAGINPANSLNKELQQLITPRSLAARARRGS
tara:strand:- start:755 stop:3883 length:3129 start_codon:yes stop_codon:yes gene_type:complete